MKPNDFLLYPLDTGEDYPACPACGQHMAIAEIEARNEEPNFISYRCDKCGRTEKVVCEE